MGEKSANYLDSLSCERLAVAITKNAAADYVRSHGTDLAARSFFVNDRIFRTMNIDGEKFIAIMDKIIESGEKGIKAFLASLHSKDGAGFALSLEGRRT